jgi:hypothetical protein
LVLFIYFVLFYFRLFILFYHIFSADVVGVIGDNTDATTLAIGDGANDVPVCYVDIK